MIKYNAIQNKYTYKVEDIDAIISLIQNGNFYNMDNCTQENITTFVKSINDFISHIQVILENVELERHETEDEARKYFGEEFITKFDQLLTTLDKQETMVALHGTREEVCPKICEDGLQYKLPSLSSTAVQQRMAYGQHEMHYDNYESLLNWGHRNYKGLVILAIPYECYYKEGLWNRFQETNSSFYGGQDYRIDPDFVVGYIDVTNKKIVLNPKYNRHHNYSGYIKDNELFREQLNMNNSILKQAIIESEAQIDKEIAKTENQPLVGEQNEQEKQIDISKIPYIIEDLIGTFNSIKGGFPNGMTESRYKYFLEELSYGFNDIAKVIPLLKTNDQVKREQEEKFSMFNDSSSTVFQSSSDFDDFDWGDDIQWENSVPEPKRR